MRAEMRRAVLRFASDVFFGIAVGLIGYYALTAAAGALAQRQLRIELADLGAAGRPSPDRFVVDSGPVMDFEDWEEEDQAYWTALEEGGVFGRLVIPEIGLDTVIVKGTARSDLKKGPGWIEWTELPGPSGNCGIAGHRTTYLAPFRRIDALVAGDNIDFYSPFRRYRYLVVNQLVVTPNRVEVMKHTDVSSLTLSACHPPYSAKFRLIVRAQIADVRRLETAE
jgi:LPXTG-site transpeptidase (sortase) family protein